MEEEDIGTSDFNTADGDDSSPVELSSIFTSLSILESCFGTADCIVNPGSVLPRGFEFDDARELSGERLPIGLLPFLLRDLSFNEDPEDVLWSVLPRLSSEFILLGGEESRGRVITTVGDVDEATAAPLIV